MMVRVSSSFNRLSFVAVVGFFLLAAQEHQQVAAFAVSSPIVDSSATTTSTSSTPEAGGLDQAVSAKKRPLNTVAVTGATGRTGRLIVQELLYQKKVDKILAIVRDTEKAESFFADYDDDDDNLAQLEIVKCDFLDESEITQVVTDNQVEAVIWCATGFADAPTPPPAAQPSSSPKSEGKGLFGKIKGFLGFESASSPADDAPEPETTPAIFVGNPEQSIDLIGLPAFAKALQMDEKDGGDDGCPKIVMCSSGGVTRTIWSEDKKEKYKGAADIPIVRLNPFGILDRKRESEEKLREICANRNLNYCIVRPCGLNDDWPSGARPVLSQGDVSVGRLNRKDLAEVLVTVLSEPHASRKTFEVLGLAGYPQSLSLEPVLARLRDDSSELTDQDVAANYNVLQQLLPGEKQDAAALAMGQTYEQLDKDETGRLGERGKEDAEAAAPKPSS